ncbi:hypothetical protein [Piscinibacter koreensis]|nr:hypothetical protein [Schlegelella koreensis]
MDPGNAVPWLHVAGAAARKDLQTQAEAVHRAASAQAYRAYTDEIVGWIAPLLPADLTPLERHSTLETIAMVANSTTFPFSPFGFCSKADVADVNRRQACEALGSMLLSKGTNLVTQIVGAGVLQQAGRPAEEIAAIKEEATALQQLAADVFTQQTLACESLRDSEAMLVRGARLGELENLRQRFAASGMTARAYLAATRASGAGQGTEGAFTPLPSPAAATPSLR